MVTLIIEKIEKDPEIPFFCKKAKTNTNKKAIIQYEYKRGKDQETENKLWKQMNSEGEIVNLVYRYDIYMFNFDEKKKFLRGLLEKYTDELDNDFPLNLQPNLKF